jgi:malate dehydrogenase
LKKVTIVGAGRVGESTAQILAQQGGFRHIVLTDIREGMAQGVALDIQQSGLLLGFDTRVTGSDDPSAMAESDVVVITAGLPRKPGMSRSDVLDANLKVTSSVMTDVMRYAPDAFVIVVTNPVDVLTYAAWKHSGWERRRIFGLSGVLDSARMAAFIALETGLSARDITALVLGGHGDSMVPMPRYTTINGIPIDHFLDQRQIEAIVQRTRQGGAEILALKKSGSANDSPAAAVAVMVDAVLRDRKRVLPCVALLDGEYGERDIAIGVPVILGERGMERVIDLELSDEERRAFSESVAQVRKDLTSIGAR